MSDDSMIKRPYNIVVYDPEWVKKFKKIKNMLQEIFAEKALQIEHVGSTAMPGMTSKGVIDVCVIVDSMEQFEAERQQMQKLGYKFRVDYINPNTLMIYKEKPNAEKEVNIHVIAKDNVWDAEKFILERDYFIAHPQRMQMYNELKAKLFREFPTDYPAYRDGKQNFLKETADLARKWKEEQNQ